MKKVFILFPLVLISILSVVYSQQPPNFLDVKQFGGSLTDKAYDIVLDNSGNILSTGAFSGTTDFDPGPGVYNLTAGNYDIYISKLDSEGNFLWAKSFGIYPADYGYAIAVDGVGNVYTTGYFQDHADFDPGPGEYFLNAAGNEDIFILKLSPDGDFIWAKRIGGTGNDFGNSIKVNAIGNVSVAGEFESTVDFDPGPNTYFLSTNGNFDAFVVTLDSSGNFLWAKNWGGSSGERALSMAIDALGNIYTTGFYQFTVDFDPGPEVYALTSAGQSDVFVSALDASGNFLWAKSMGGPLGDNGIGIAVDMDGNIITTGDFAGTADFDPGPFTYQISTPGYGFFLSKLDPLGNFTWAIGYGYPGGGGTGESIVTDEDGNIYFTGRSAGTIDFDPGPGNFNITTYGGYDSFISKLDSGGNFSWAMHLGGTGEENSRGIALDMNRNVYSTGDFVGTADFDPTNNSVLLTADNRDIYIVKLCQLETPTITAGGPTTICLGDSVILTASAAYSYLWSNGETTQNISVTESGNYSVTVYNANGCPAFSTDLITVLVLPFPPPEAAITINGSSTICEGESITLSVSTCSGCSYLWSSGQISPTIEISPLDTTDFWVTVSNNAGCISQSDTITINVNPLPIIEVTEWETICIGDSILLNASGGDTYSWSPSISLSDANISAPIAFPSSTTTYTVTGTTNGCSDTDTVTVVVFFLTVVASPSDTSICPGESVELTAFGAESFHWLPIDVVVPTIVVTPDSNITYMVVGTTNGCSDTTAVHITLKTSPDVTVEQQAATLCKGESIQLKAYGAEIFIWSPPDSLSDISLSNPWANPSESTTYTVTGYLDGCSDTANVEITVNPLPQVNAVPDSVAICLGDSTLLNAYNAETFVWSPTEGLSDYSIPNPWAKPTMSMTYTVTGTKDGCSNTDQVTVTVITPPGPPVEISGPSMVCADTTYIFSVPNVPGADIIIWELPFGWAGTAMGNTIEVIPTETSGEIFVFAGNGCGNSDPFVFSVTASPNPPKPIITPNGHILISDAPTGNQWYKNGVEIPDATDTIYIADENGYYWVIVTLNGCSSEPSEPVVINTVDDASKIASMRVFPNPTTGIIYVIGHGLTSDDYRIRLINPIGQILNIYDIKAYDNSFEFEIDITSFGSGVYFLTIELPDYNFIWRVLKL